MLPTVILGAGLAGLSVARALLRECPSTPIVLVDRRSTWERDRTWCFWATPGIPDTALATAQWQSWNTIGPSGTFTQRSARHPYLHLPADRFYDASLSELASAANVELATDTRVLAVRPGQRGVVVDTSRGELLASAVVDAMGGGGPLLADRPSGEVELRQQFVGLEVEVERPIFDPGSATLMDFRVPGSSGGVRFMYVLPFSATRALIEDTSIAGPPVTGIDRRRAIEIYLSETLGAGAAHVLRTERGSLPMTTYPFPSTRGDARVIAAGQAAGAARPSSGYAFVRTQRHASALAQSLLRGTPTPSARGPKRRRALDRQFLLALRAAPESAPNWFLALAQHVPGDVFARFMSDASTAADEARILRALARPDFLAAVARRPTRGSQAWPGAHRLRRAPA